MLFIEHKSPADEIQNTTSYIFCFWLSLAEGLLLYTLSFNMSHK